MKTEQCGREVVMEDNSIKQGQNEAFLNDFNTKESKRFQRKLTEAFTNYLYDMMVMSDVMGKGLESQV